MAGYTRQSIAQIINGSAITAPPLNAEFNQLEDAFDASTGHNHTGAEGDAPKINLTTSVSGYLPAVHGGVGGKNNLSATSNPSTSDDSGDGYAPGSLWENTTTGRIFICVGNTANAAVWRELVQVETSNVIKPISHDSIDLGSPSVRFQDLYLSGGIGATGNASLGGTLSVTGASTFTGAVTANGGLTVNGTTTLAGNVTIGDALSSLDTIAVAAGFTSNLLPDANAGVSLGSSTKQWNNLYIDGTATIDTLTVDENATVAGTLGVTGTSTLSTANITNITATGTINLAGATVSNLGTVTTAAIGGGSLNNVVIGGSTPAAITGTTITGTSLVGPLTGNVTGNVTGNLTGNVTGNVTGNLTGNVTATSGTSNFTNVTISGQLNMDASSTGTITNLTAPSSDLDAATKKYVDDAIDDLLDGAPGTLDTLNELAAAINDDASAYNTLNTAIGNKLPKAGGTMSGAINMGGQKITNAADPTAAQDLATKNYIDTTYIDYSSAADAANDAEKLAVNAEDVQYTLSDGSTTGYSALHYAAKAAASYDSFDDRYLGSKASDPTLDNDNNALITGALYFDSTNGVMKVYNGTEWANASSSIEGIKSNFYYTATSGQTAFSGTDDNSNTLVVDKAGLVNVYMNGVRLHEDDYTVSAAGDSVTLSSGAAAGDLIYLEVFGNFAGQSGADVAITGGSITGLTSLGVSGAITATDRITGDGSEAAPAFRFTNDTNTGMFPPAGGDALGFSTGGSEAARFAASGDFLVGKTSTSINTAGSRLIGGGAGAQFTADGTESLALNRLTNDGDLIWFGKSGSKVGSIGVHAGDYLTIGEGASGLIFNVSTASVRPWNMDNTTSPDGVMNLGSSNGRFKDLWLSGRIEIEKGTGNTAVGTDALENSTAAYNTAFGWRAGKSTTTGRVVAVGADSLLLNTTGQKNVGMGDNSLYNNTTGSYNTAMGHQALNSNTTSNSNTAIGYQALLNNTAGFNTAVGTNAGDKNTSGSSNVFVGYEAGKDSTTASELTFVGYRAGENVTGASNTAMGRHALRGTTAGSTGARNVAIGESTMVYNTTGSDNIAIGKNALLANTSGNSNVAIGYLALDSNTSGSLNVLVGREAGEAMTTATEVTGVGYQVLNSLTTGIDNTAFGTQAMFDTTTGQKNAAFGKAALADNTTGNYNTAIGLYAMRLHSTGDSNVAVGYQALYSDTSASETTAVGYQALYAQTSGRNTAFGYKAGFDLTSGNYNIIVGGEAGESITTGDENTILGYQAGRNITTGGQNTAIGYLALYNNTTTSSCTAVGSLSQYTSTGVTNNSFGRASMRLNTTGTQNCAFGNDALESNTTGSGNVAMGHRAGAVITTGSNNTVIGREAGDALTTTNSNTFVGRAAGTSCTGHSNTLLGEGAGSGMTSANDNTFVGQDAGSQITGSKNTVLGCYNGNQSGIDIRTSSNNIVISDGDGNARMGFSSAGPGSYINSTSTYTQFSWLNTGSTKAAIWWDNTNNQLQTYTNNYGPYLNNGSTSWVTYSDERLKTVTGEISDGLNKVSQIRAAEYYLNADEEQTPLVGVIAQDVLSVLPEAVVVPPDGATGRDGSEAKMGVHYDYLIPLLIAALKEAKTKIEDLEARVATVEG